MNTFAQIVYLGKTDRVHLYSVQIGEEEPEYVKWDRKHRGIPEVVEEYNDIRAWIRESICKVHGAKERFFRHEEAAVALPPNAQYLTIKYHFNLRLYCFRIRDNVLILLNGGIKTQDRAQDCEVVGQHFRFANKVCRQIQAGIVDKLIIIQDDGQLTIHPEFEILL